MTYSKSLLYKIETFCAELGVEADSIKLNAIHDLLFDNRNVKVNDGENLVTESDSKNFMFRGLGIVAESMIAFTNPDSLVSDYVRLVLEKCIEISGAKWGYVTEFNAEREEVFMIYTTCISDGCIYFNSAVYSKNLVADCIWENIMGIGEDVYSPQNSIIFSPESSCENGKEVSNFISVHLQNEAGFIGNIVLADIPLQFFNECSQLVTKIADLYIIAVKERRRRLEYLKSEKHYNSLFEHMHVGFIQFEIIVNENHEPVDLLIVNANPVSKSILNFYNENVEGKQLSNVSGEVSSEFLNQLFQVGLLGNVSNFEYQSTFLNKVLEIKAFSPKMGYVGLLISDISAKWKLASELAEMDRALKTLMSNLPGIAYRCKNDQNWTMEFISDGCFDLTGYQPSDLIGNRLLSFNEIILPEFRNELWSKWQTILTNKDVFIGEYKIKTRNGNHKWVWERGCGVFSTTGQLLALEGFIIDISEQKKFPNQ